MSVVPKPVAGERSLPADGQARPVSSALFRAVNERIRELAAAWGGEYDFICECDDGACLRVLRLTEAEYEALRAYPDRFAVLPGHERTADEVVGQGDGYVVVRRRQVDGPAVPAGADGGRRA